ncbi:FAD-dependent oxidoreductase [Streptomyces scabiei]|uniref:FAD-dependent oxidoreductase n=2 Tax=Streptomyces scabiei TaxID=1930 RepID=UPI0029C0B989|nr:FAD-dependent oxidoreductase [Streptomyces scabiei]
MEPHMSRQDSHDVIVIGAGASGLAAAAALRAAGRDVVALEARNRIGARLLSAPAERPGRALDLGDTWFWDGEERVRTLAARSGLETFDQHLAGDTMFEETTGTRRLTGNLIEAPSRRFTAGTQGVAGALAAALPPGSLRLDTPVTAIHPNGQDGLDVLTPAGTLHAEHVVLAVPPALALERIDFGDTLPADLVGLARATPVWMGAVAKVVADYPTAFWREGGLAGAALSRTGPLQEVHDMSGPGGEPAALFGVAHARTVRPASSRPSPPSSPGSSARPPDAPWPCTSRTGRQSIGPPRPPCSTSPTTRSSVPPLPATTSRWAAAQGVDRDGDRVRRAHRRRPGRRRAGSANRPGKSWRARCPSRLVPVNPSGFGPVP